MRPRIRTIKPEMWADERVASLSRDARLLFVALITMADDEGRFRARRSAILGHAVPDDDDAIALIDRWIAELKEGGLIVFYVSGDTPYGAFRHWRKHQKINRPTPSDLPPPPDPKVARENRVKSHGSFTETSRNAPRHSTDTSVDTHSSTRRRAFRSDPNTEEALKEKAVDLRARIAALIQQNDRKANPKPDSAAWVNSMRLLIADRGGDDAAISEIARIIDWCQADEFWRANILSPGKLRKQFTHLVIRTQAGQVVPIDGRGHRPSPSDLLNALDGQEAS